MFCCLFLARTRVLLHIEWTLQRVLSTAEGSQVSIENERGWKVGRRFGWPNVVRNVSGEFPEFASRRMWTILTQFLTIIEKSCKSQALTDIHPTFRKLVSFVSLICWPASRETFFYFHELMKRFTMMHLVVVVYIPIAIFFFARFWVESWLSRSVFFIPPHFDHSSDSSWNNNRHNKRKQNTFLDVERSVLFRWLIVVFFFTVFIYSTPLPLFFSLKLIKNFLTTLHVWTKTGGDLTIQMKPLAGKDCHRRPHFCVCARVFLPLICMIDVLKEGYKIDNSISYWAMKSSTSWYALLFFVFPLFFKTSFLISRGFFFNKGEVRPLSLKKTKIL